MAAKRVFSVLFAIAALLALLGFCPGNLAWAADEPPPPTFAWNVNLDHWQILGPFPKLKADRNSAELERELVPNEGELQPGQPVQVDGKEFRWLAWPGRMIDFIEAFDLKPADAEYKLVYAYTQFTSDTEQKAILAVSHDDCARVWLNGKDVYRKDAWAASQLDQGRIEVTLAKGTNRLLAKVCNGLGDWEFAARLLPADVEKPLVSMSASGSNNGNMARLPLLNVEYLDGDGKATQSLEASGGRDGRSGAKYTIYAQAPDPEPAKIRVHFDRPGFLPFDKTFNWSQAKNGSIWISLSAKDRLRGQVVDEKTGQPVVGAEFFAGESAVSKKSDADGRFEFTLRDPLADIVEVRAAGYEPTLVRVQHEGAWTVKIPPGGHTFRGRVLAEDGTPISGARIEGNVNRRNFTLLTDAAGRFEISGLPSDDREIYPTVSHPEFVAKDRFSQPLEDDGVTEVEWRLERGGVIEGRVTTKDDGKPVPGIEVVSGADRFASNVVTPKAITDSEGRFRLTGIPQSTVMVHAFSRDFVPASQMVSVVKDKPASAGFELVKGKAISGRVVDPAGKPIQGVTLAIDTINGSRMLERRTNTDANGEFRYENMPDTPVKIDMFKSGWVSKRDFESTGGQHTVLTMHPIIEHQLHVRASDTGKPPQGLTSQIGYQWEGRGEISWQEEDYSGNSAYDPATGVFTTKVDELSNTKLFFRVRAPGYREFVFEHPELGKPAKSMGVTLEKVATAGGKVVDADTGQPLAGVLVALVNKEDRLRMDHYSDFSNSYRAIEEFTGIEARTTDDGSFELSQPTSDQPTDIVLFHEGKGFHYIPNAREVLAAGNTTLPLPAGGTVEGRILVAGEPVADAPVHISWFPPGDRNESWEFPFGFGGQIKTDADGRYRYTGLGPGTYQINRLRNFQWQSGRGSMSSYLLGGEVTVLPGQTVTHDFIIPPGHKVSGEVVDPEGKPAADCQVEIMSDQARNERVDVVFTKADGRFEFQHLQPGSYTLRVEQFAPNEWGGFNPGGGRGTGTVKVADGDATTSIKITSPQRSGAPTAAPRATSVTFAAAAPAPANTIVGAIPPDFSGKLFGSDETFNLTEHFGKVVAIDFWATWRVPCMAAMPELKKLHEKYKDSNDVVFVTVSLDQDAEALKTAIEEQGLEFPVIFESRDASQAIASSFGVSDIPASFVIGRDGRFASERVHGSQLVAALEKAIASPPTPRFGVGVKPSRLTVKLSLDDSPTGPSGAAITFKAFDDIGMPVNEETVRTAGRPKQLSWHYAPFENGGRIEVKVEVDGLAPQEKTVESPGENAEVAFDFQSPRAIRGRVALAAEENGGKELPVAGVKVILHSTVGLQRKTTTDADGKFEMRVMPGSYYLMAVGTDDFAPIMTNREQLEVGTDNDPAPLKIPACRTVTVKGTVLDDNEQPVEGADVRTTMSEKVVKTDAEGRFELPGVPSKGQVHLYALKQPKSAIVMLEDCDGKEPQTLVLGTQPGRGTGRLSKGAQMPRLPLVTLADGEPVDWQPAGKRDVLIVFAPLWNPMSRDFVTRAKAWADEHDADLVTVSTDWSLDQARREVESYGDLVPSHDAILFAGPGGLALAKDWVLTGKPQAYLISAGKIIAAPSAGKLP